MEPLDPFHQFAYLGNWQENSSPAVKELVDQSFAAVKEGQLKAFSDI